MPASDLHSSCSTRTSELRREVYGKRTEWREQPGVDPGGLGPGAGQNAVARRAPGGWFQMGGNKERNDDAQRLEQLVVAAGAVRHGGTRLCCADEHSARWC